jgi:hypothetical protein
MLTPPYAGDASTATTAFTSYKDNVIAGTIKGFGQGTTDPTVDNTYNGNLVNYTSSSYNTGWMNGDIKLATLSDTDDTNVTGSELVANGLFSNGGDWSFGGGWNFANGQAEIDSTNNDLLSQDIGMVSGKTYTVTLYVTQYTDGYVSVRLGGTEIGTASATGFYTFTGVAAGSTLQIYGFTNPTLAVDDISVRLAEQDRSVNGNGLQVFGTMTKTAVATGADLVSYSGFSSGSNAGNYIQQPFNNTHSPGTGDFLYSFWINAAASSNETFIDHSGGSNVTSNPRLRIHAFDATSGILRVYIADGALTPLELPSTLSAANSTWNQVVAVREAGIVKIYINGELDATAAWAGDMTRTGGQIRLGLDGDGTDPLSGSLSLFKYGFTAPTAEQIKKIYEDEKFLFQENAKCTLYGSSDSVTALAYDDDTELLHVGTSAGRSVFQGLRRIDNTTDAVGAAISASNGMVAED